MAETKARFTGAVSFPNRADSVRFTETLNEFLDHASKVFFEIEKNPMFPTTALGSAKLLLDLCENFELK